MKKTCAVIAVIFASLALTISNANSADKYWVGESGLWDDPANWSFVEGGIGGAGIPVDGENVFLVQSDDINRNVDYNVNTLSSREFYGSLVIDSTGSGDITLSQSTDLYVRGEKYIGYDGAATFNQTEGLFYTHYDLYLGYHSGSTGTYNLSGGTLGNYYSDTYIGYEGAGTFNHTGGYFSSVAIHIGENGTYNSSGQATISTEAMFVEGTFNFSADYANLGHLIISESGTLNIYENTELHTDLRVHGGMINQFGGTMRNYDISPPLDGTYNQYGGTLLSNDSDGYYKVGPNGIHNLSGGILTGPERGVVNDNIFNYSGGSIDSNFINNADFNLSGSGTRQVNGDVVNNGTVKNTHTNAVFNGTFTNNGAYISDPASQYFQDLIVGDTGYLVGQYSDFFYLSGDFISSSIMNYDWNTKQSYLAFIEGEDNLHDFYLTGEDFGLTMSGVADNFSWGTLDISANVLSLFDGNEEFGAGLYLRNLVGAEIFGDTISNIFGNDGITIYYNKHLQQNSYLAGLDYNLSGGGYLRAMVPEPTTMLLFGTGLAGLVGTRLRRKNRLII